MAALFAADMFLAKTERAESLVQARHLFAQGRTLMQRGENAEAIERIKNAISIARKSGISADTGDGAVRGRQGW